MRNHLQKYKTLYNVKLGKVVSNERAIDLKKYNRPARKLSYRVGPGVIEVLTEHDTKISKHGIIQPINTLWK